MKIIHKKKSSQRNSKCATYFNGNSIFNFKFSINFFNKLTEPYIPTKFIIWSWGIKINIRISQSGRKPKSERENERERALPFTNNDTPTTCCGKTCRLSGRVTGPLSIVGLVGTTGNRGGVGIRTFSTAWGGGGKIGNLWDKKRSPKSPLLADTRVDNNKENQGITQTRAEYNVGVRCPSPCGIISVQFTTDRDVQHWDDHFYFIRIFSRDLRGKRKYVYW